MNARIVARTRTGLTVQVEVPYEGSMLDSEDAIQRALSEAGVAATAEALARFDAGGRPITVDGVKLTSKGRLPKDYQPPYGVATVRRHVYQPSRRHLLPARPRRVHRGQLDAPVRQGPRP